MIIDGPIRRWRRSAQLLTGSANWSIPGTRYGENTVVARGVPELAEFQREFDLL
jgi:hypothetical protein